MNADDYETLPTDNVGTHMIAGAIAGVMEHCVMYPLDSVKVSVPQKGSRRMSLQKSPICSDFNVKCHPYFKVM